MKPLWDANHNSQQATTKTEQVCLYCVKTNHFTENCYKHQKDKAAVKNGEKQAGHFYKHTTQEKGQSTNTPSSTTPKK